MRPRRTAERIVLFLGAGAWAAFGYPKTSDIFPRIRAGLRERTLFPLESNPRRERAKMNRLTEHLEKLFPSVWDEELEIALPPVTEDHHHPEELDEGAQRVTNEPEIEQRTQPCTPLLELAEVRWLKDLGKPYSSRKCKAIA